MHAQRPRGYSAGENGENDESSNNAYAVFAWGMLAAFLVVGFGPELLR